jgi:hypothetical protein
MAPERLDGGSGDKSIDIYALAAVAFEMLSGRKAVEGSSPLEIARRVATAPPPDLRDFVGGAPEGAAEALKRGLAKRPEERQGSAGELVRELSAAYAAQAEENERSRRATAVVPEPQPEPEPEPPRREETSTGNGHGNGQAAVVGAIGGPAREPAHRPAPAVTHRARSSRRWAIPAAIALAAVLLLVVLVAGLSSSGGGSDNKSSSGDKASKGAEKSSSQPKSQDSGGSSATPTPAAPATAAAPADDNSTPTGAVSSLYKGSIDDPHGAYQKFAGPGVKRQVSEQDFVNQESTLKSIDFPQLKVTEQSGNTATVQFQSIARHTTKTDRCHGTMGVVKGESGWLVDRLGVTCTHGPPS